ncbi:MAG: hypothetical protein QNL62_18395, partial [Gammaproteobacteria bacterium]|nr:hypothetical protein [Gammaproteobacteria bacterium]
YKSRKYDKWWGLSALVTMTGDNGMGYGALLRWNDFTFGTAYHDKSNDMLVYVNVDLFQYILGEDGRTSQFDTFAKAAIERVKEKQQKSTPQ